MDNEIFQGIPSLDDTQGMSQYMDNLNNPNPTPNPNPAPATNQGQAPEQGTDNSASQPNTAAPVQMTNEQLNQLLDTIAERQQAQAQQINNLNNYQQRPMQQAQPTTPQQAYTAQQAAVIKQLIDRQVPLDRIMQAMRGNAPANNESAQLAQRLAAIEQTMQDQQYLAERDEFITKMHTFGDKYGLSEQDLVTFGNKAMTMGINIAQLANADAVEMVFKSLYPEQYNVRAQRLSNTASSQIYGGSNIPVNQNIAAQKAIDAYTENFLRKASGSQYKQP